MAPRFDAEGFALRLSVADLVDARLARNLGFAHRGGYERMWLGQAIHSRYQEESLAGDPDYRREVPLAVTFPHRGWEVTVEGRADGLRRDPDGALVVEEIKSVRRGSRPSPATLELYRRQALLYAWMLHRLGEETVRAELVLIEIGGDALDRQPVDGEPRQLEAAVRQRVNHLLRAHEQRQEERARRRGAASRLEFPYPEPRPGQERIVAAVERAVEDGEHLLVEAATGIGKTVAALHPALRHALARDRRVFVLTAKTLQQEMANTVLALLNREGAFRSLQLRAKAAMCANDEVICHEDFCPYARDYFLKLERGRVLEGLSDDDPILLPDRIYEVARSAEVCPFEVSLEMAGRSQVVVCDYNYAFAPHVALSDFGPEADLSDVILVIDEVHNLVDRGRGYYSPELSAERARRAAEALARRGEPLTRRIAGLCRDLAELVERSVGEALELAPGGGDAVECRLPEDELWGLRPDLDAAFVDYLELQRETKGYRAEDPFVELYFEVLRFLDTLVVSGGEEFSHCAERRGADRVLRILCKDASRFLGEVLGRCHAVVGLSATLSPPEFYRDLVGLDPERAATISVPAPFPPANRRVVIDPSVATTYRARSENYAPIAERVGALADAVPGNCLALFPSYDFLGRVAALLSPASKRVLVQERTASGREREAILDALRSSLFGDVLLLAVAGGVFAEGVDYPGDMLKAVAVVGPCLPAVSLERALLRAYYQERFERGFEYAFVVPGMTRVVQAAGRLIRSAHDVGVIALLDRRFLERPYRRHLPEEWLDGAEAEALAGEPGRVGAEFFGRMAGGA